MDTCNGDDSLRETSLAVEGRGIFFNYGRKEVSTILNNLNITVNPGTIYSLLGPSGCGKTTLLKCVVGLLNPQKGSLKVYGRNPGSQGFFIPGRGVGYMPQDLALYNEMTAMEILRYFGSMYGMSMKNIPERINFLLELLQLADRKKLIWHLSGGQKRRVSFAIALIHKPPLLILDEPTVGVDPILRKAIWDHLVSLTQNEHSTIIITTHYIEEARQAHTVGLMRNGHLLVERNPGDLVRQYGGCTLEDVFLTLCRKNRNEDEDNKTNTGELFDEGNVATESQSPNDTVWMERATDESHAITLKFVSQTRGTSVRTNSFVDNNTDLLHLPAIPKRFCNEDFSPVSSWMRLFYLTRKNFLRFKRNIFGLLFTNSLAAIQVTLFFLCFSSNASDLQVAVVNEDTGLNKLSEKYVHSISDGTISKKPFHNFTSAYESLVNGKSWAVLHMNSEFSHCLADRFLEGSGASNDTLQCSTIEVLMDMSNYVIAGSINVSVLKSYQVFTSELLKSFGKNPLLAEVPLSFEDYTHGTKPATISDFLAPALLVCIPYIMGISIAEMCLIMERKYGLLPRTLVAGATTTEVVMSFFLALLAMVMLQLLMVLTTSFWIFSAPCKGPMFWVIVADILSGICGMSHGFFISAVTDDENLAGLIAFGSFFANALLSASFWPVEGMPYFFRYLSYGLPLTRLIEGKRSIMTRGWTISDNYVWDGYLLCLLWIIVYMTLSIIFLKIRK